MIAIQYPESNLLVKQNGNTRSVFDPIRRKWLVLTPEEWVRQHFIEYLTQVAGYPPALIAIEKKLIVGELTKRFDILVYNRSHQPFLMIECKAASVALNDSVLQQALRYNMSAPVEFVIITNGISTYGWQKVNNQLITVNEIPVIP